MFYKIFFSAILTACFICTSCLAQQKNDSVRHYNNAVYFELGGPALVYSVGYERTWYRNNWFSAMSSAGFSYIPGGIAMGYLEPGVLFRKKNLAFEMGAALMSYRERSSIYRNDPNITDNSGAALMLFLSTRVGLRYYTRNQHLHFRTGITPIKELWDNNSTLSPQDKRFLFWVNVLTVAYRF